MSTKKMVPARATGRKRKSDNRRAPRARARKDAPPGLVETLSAFVESGGTSLDPGDSLTTELPLALWGSSNADRARVQADARETIEQLDALTEKFNAWRASLQVVAATGVDFVGIMNPREDGARLRTKIRSLHAALGGSSGPARAHAGDEVTTLSLEARTALRERQGRAYASLSASEKKHWRACLMRFVDYCARDTGPSSPSWRDLGWMSNALPFEIEAFDTANETPDRLARLLALWPDDRPGAKKTPADGSGGSGGKWTVLVALLDVVWGAKMRQKKLEQEWAELRP